jgi:hypothetical protein
LHAQKLPFHYSQLYAPQATTEAVMALEGTLKNRNGALYVLYTFDEDSAPVRQYIWYRVLGTRGTGYGEHPEAGDLTTRVSAGDWRARNPTTQRLTGYVSTGTGSTLAELVERVDIPPPATAGKKIRWHQGRWEKLLARGWAPAGEGKTKGPKKVLAHATQKQGTLRKTPRQLNAEIAEALRDRSSRQLTAQTHNTEAKDSRVVVFGKPGAPPLHVSPWMTKAHADREVRKRRAMNSEYGHHDYEVVLEPRWMVEEREEYAQRRAAAPRTW